MVKYSKDMSAYILLIACWQCEEVIGETAQSIEPPTACCSYQDTGKLCDKSTCFSCNSIREAQAQMVRGTLLVMIATSLLLLLSTVHI